MIQDISPRGCIEFAIATEELGAKFYDRLAQRFDDSQETSDLFILLGKDEEAHKIQFSDLLKHLSDEVGVLNSPEKSQYIRAMSISEFFSRDKGPFVNIDKIKDRNDALEKVFGFEKATLGFYQAVQDSIGRNSILNQVIEAEKGHVARIMKVILTGEKFRSLQDPWP